MRISVPRGLSYSVLLLASTVAGLLTGCGGGGEGVAHPSATPAGQTFPLSSAGANRVNAPFSSPLTVSGTYQQASLHGTGTFSFSAPAGAVFEGQAALQVSTSLALTLTGPGGSVPVNSNVREYFASADYAYLGATDGTTFYDLASPPTTLPATAKVGDSGLYASETLYTDSTKTVKTGTRWTTWSLQSDSATTVLLTLSSQEYDNAGNPTLQTTETDRVDIAGRVTFVSGSGSELVNGSPLTFTFTAQ
jgi:hypothetical protein